MSSLRCSWLSLLLLVACPGDKDSAPQDSSGYDDLDGDGFDSSLDCVDINSAIYPDATELCNGLDDDCDGLIDEPGSAGGTRSYLDLDTDGYGDDATSVTLCAAVSGYVTEGGDCDDADATSSPAGAETCDGKDNDCNGETDEIGATGGSTYHQDNDGDGYGHPLLTVEGCAPGDGAVEDTSDCDDDDATRHPGAEETCDGADDDCDASVDEDASDETSWYRDSDADNFGADGDTMTSCDAPEGYVAVSGDCDDSDSLINPARVEQCDGVDNDCDGSIDPDC